jgi:hypothetical protein
MPVSRRKDWSWRRDLNSGPPAPKAESCGRTPFSGRQERTIYATREANFPEHLYIKPDSNPVRSGAARGPKMQRARGSKARALHVFDHPPGLRLGDQLLLGDVGRVYVIEHEGKCWREIQQGSSDPRTNPRRPASKSGWHPASGTRDPSQCKPSPANPLIATRVAATRGLRRMLGSVDASFPARSKLLPRTQPRHGHQTFLRP